MSALFSPITRLMPRKAAEPSADAEPDDLLVELASRLDSDGSMPGRDTAERVLATLVALLAFLSEGHSTTSGAFRMHVRRMVKFLESGVLDPLSEDQRRIAGQVLDAVRGNHPPKGDWATLAKAPHVRWEQLDAK